MMIIHKKMFIECIIYCCCYFEVIFLKIKRKQKKTKKKKGKNGAFLNCLFCLKEKNRKVAEGPFLDEEKKNY